MTGGSNGAAAAAPDDELRAPGETRAYDHLDREGLVALLRRRDRERALISLNWAADKAQRDGALNDDFVTLRLVPELCERAEPWQNLIIEGENFDALRWLRMTMRGGVKVIYADPPYNTGNRDWVYNDSYRDPSDPFFQTAWLEFLHRRFALARDLLADDGVLLVSINDENRAVLEMMLNQTLPGMRIGSLVWRTRTGANEGREAFLSDNHEHVLVYGNRGFRFGGTAKSLSMYSNPDNDPRGDWTSGDLTINVSYTDRRAGKGYYPIHDPQTDIYYPCNPDAVWRYASRALSGAGTRIKTKFIEDWLEHRQIVFPKRQRVHVYKSRAELDEAIAAGDVPRSGRSPLLREGLPDLDFWVGKKVGFGTPRFKRFVKDLKTATQPLSSWIKPQSELRTVDKGENAIVSGTNDEGAKAIKAIFGEKTFNYAKPPSLIRGLIEQASSPGDVVLDFFAGSATTAQAVVELNAEDGGGRRFILVSHDEKTDAAPERNLARDVMRERVTRLNERATTSKSDAPVPFAYLRTLRIPTDRLMDEEGALTPEDVWLAVQTMHGLPLSPYNVNAPFQLHEGEDVVVAFCDRITDEAVSRIAARAEHRKGVHVYAWTVGPMRRALEGSDAEFHRLPDALWRRFKS